MVVRKLVVVTSLGLVICLLKMVGQVVKSFAGVHSELDQIDIIGLF